MQHKKIILCAFVISGLQVQLLSLAPRKILRYTVKAAACIVGFLLLYALKNARKVRQKCDKSHKTASSATVCAPVLYALPYIIRLYNELSLPLLWAGRVAFHDPPTYSPTYGGAVSGTDPIHKGVC